MQNLLQEDLFDLSSPLPEKSRTQLDTEQSGTFSPNMKLPVHRWFRYSAGFSADWAGSVISQHASKVVLDPFVGSGTVCLEADKRGLKSYGIESHPFVYKLASGKLSWAADIEEFKAAISEIEKQVASLVFPLPEKIPLLLEKCYEKTVLEELFKLKEVCIQLAPQFSDNIRSLLFLAVNAILRPTSHVGTAQWQYVLPNKRKERVVTPVLAFKSQALMMESDMLHMQKIQRQTFATLLQSDARTLQGVPDNSVDLVLTSPPYANNYDYADATRLEMTFWGEVDSWGDLHDAVRRHLICSSSQHSSKDQLKLEDLLAKSSVDPIRDELSAVCHELDAVRSTKGGNKSYHTMIAAYFADMGETFKALRRVTTQGSTLCLVIGDSAPYGVHAPAEKWFTKQAVSFGFHDCSFEKIRDRNVKWKNRKHTVPLHEGRLWIRG